VIQLEGGHRLRQQETQRQAGEQSNNTSPRIPSCLDPADAGGPSSLDFWSAIILSSPSRSSLFPNRMMASKPFMPAASAFPGNFLAKGLMDFTAIV